MIKKNPTLIPGWLASCGAMFVVLYLFMSGDGRCAQPPIGQSKVPLWKQSPLVSEETVLFRVDQDGQTYAELLFSPTKLLSIASVNGTAVFPVSDFEIQGRKLVAKGNVPSISDEDLFLDAERGLPIAAHIDKTHFLKYGEGDTFHKMQVNVTYETGDRWSGPIPTSGAELLPGLAARLANKSEVKIVVLGDSISEGANASGPIQSAPFKPPYHQMVADELERITGAKVTLVNLSKGGETSFWGETQTQAVLAQQPDVVILAFGMNDASSNMIADEFASNIRRIILDTRKGLPETELVIVSGMTPNPLWFAAKMDKRVPFHEAAKKVATKMKVSFCDVFSPWNYLVERKGFLSMTGNGVNHPNDYGHRLYSDVLLATFLGPVGSSENP